jgi:hypothetical protein
VNKEYRDEIRGYASEAPWTAWKLFVIGVLAILLISGLGLVACGVGLFTGAAHNAAAVAQKEFYPDALLRKYEWFKDASAALDKKQADIGVYDARLRSLLDAYEGVARGKWPRDDREQFSIWSSEAAGVRASYNQLAAEYNAEMSKFNWRFTNVGDVPQGGKPLPRDYRPYQEQ